MTCCNLSTVLNISIDLLWGTDSYLLPIPILLFAHRDNFYRLAPRNIINISQLSIQLGMTTSCSVAQSCLTLRDPMDCSRQASLSFTIPQNLLKLMFIELVMPSNHLILCHPLLLLPSIFPSIRVFSNELILCIR